MKRQLCTLIAIMLFICGMPSVADAKLNQRGDFQFWTKQCVFGDITNHVYVRADMEVRFGDNWRKIYYQSATFEALYRCKNWLDIGIGDEQVYLFDDTQELKDLGGKVWRLQSRPFGEVVLILRPKKGGYLEDRNRLERKMIQGDKTFWRYRNELLMIAPCDWTCVHLAPFFRNKAFVEEDDGFNLDEIYVGLASATVFLACASKSATFGSLAKT